MSVNVKTIPTELNSKNGAGAVVVTRIGANGLNADQAYFNNIDADSAVINNLQVNNITSSVINTEIVNTEIINGTQGNFTELNAEQANIYEEKVDFSNINNLYANFAGVKDLNADKAEIAVGEITELFSKEITTDYLKVLKSAHFFELIIDKISAVGGSVILSPADGFELYGWSDSTSNSIKLWWIATDDSKGKYNMWKVGDQAICQNFNNANVGTNHAVSSKYCWSLVIDVHGNIAEYVVKLTSTDELTNINSDYSSTHPTLKQSDFAVVMTAEEKRYDSNNNPLNGLWKLNNGTTILTPEQYNELTPVEQADYSLYQDAYIGYVNSNPIYITAEQYAGTVQYQGYTIRPYSQIDCKRCFAITISKSSCAQYSTFNFEEGDNFVMLGHQKQQTETADDAKKRQSAIYLSSYESIDADLKAPLICQYRNIDTFSLSDEINKIRKWNYFDRNGAKFQGQFILEDGTEIDESVYDYFKLVPNYNIFSRNGAGDVDQHTIDVNILRNINNTVEYNTTVPTGYTLYVESYTVSGSTPFQTATKTGGQSATSIAVPYNNTNFHHMVLRLVKNATTPKTVDEYIINIQLVSDGPQGAQGTAGDDGTNVTLLVAQELCSVRIDSPTTDVEFENMTTSLYTKLEYKLVKIEGDTATEIEFGQSTGYKVTLSCHDGTGNGSISYDSDSHDSNWQINSSGGWSISIDKKTLSFEQTNILDVINPSSSYANKYRNYQYLISNWATSTSVQKRTPLKFKVELKDQNTATVESRMIYVSYEPQSLFVNNKDLLYSAKLGAQGYTDGWARQFSTELYQTNQEIGAQATRLDAGIQGTQSSIAQVSLTANGAQSSVVQLTSDLNQNYYTKTEVDQTAERISLQVLGQQGVTQDQLRRTGIDITDGQITLDAENTVVTGELSLTNSNSGFVLYDEYGNPVIKIGNDSIGSFDDFNSSVLVYQWLNYVASSSSSWNITSNTKNIGTRVSGSSISLSGLILQLFAYQPDYSMSYPSSSTINATIQLLIGNTVKNPSQQPITMTFDSTYGYYTYSGTVNINIPEDGNYTLRVVTSGISGTPVSNPYLNFGYQISYVSQKMIRLAKDGFASNPVANSFIWSNNEMQILKQGQNGLRLYNPNGETNSKGLQVFAGISRINNQDVERWYNYSNYTPTKTLLGSDFTTGTAYIGDGTSENNVKIYTVEQGYGCILIPSRNELFGSGQYSRNIYIKLPAFSDVVLGYSVKIINYGQDANVRVIDGNNVSGHCYHIMDANMNMNSYIVCKGATGSGGEFMYVGQVTSHEEELNFHWRATCDV